MQHDSTLMHIQVSNINSLTLAYSNLKAMAYSQPHMGKHHWRQQPIRVQGAQGKSTGTSKSTILQVPRPENDVPIRQELG